mmetsp:Transcript_100041/g.312655  ORF Transcript_100041/g.312655 Transcript_100041/m.312655 type:complete len:503 (+) Transcript_100041:538-2046(+)
MLARLCLVEACQAPWGGDLDTLASMQLAGSPASPRPASAQRRPVRGRVRAALLRRPSPGVLTRHRAASLPLSSPPPRRPQLSAGPWGRWPAEQLEAGLALREEPEDLELQQRQQFLAGLEVLHGVVVGRLVEVRPHGGWQCACVPRVVVVLLSQVNGHEALALRHGLLHAAPEQGADLLGGEGRPREGEVDLGAEGMHAVSQVGEEQGCGPPHRAAPHEDPPVPPGDVADLPVKVLQPPPCEPWVLEVPSVCRVAYVQRVDWDQGVPQRPDLRLALCHRGALRRERDDERLLHLTRGRGVPRQVAGRQRLAEHPATLGWEAAVPGEAKAGADAPHVQPRELQVVRPQAADLQPREPRKLLDQPDPVREPVPVRKQPVQLLKASHGLWQGHEPVVVELEYRQTLELADLLRELREHVPVEPELLEAAHPPDRGRQSCEAVPRQAEVPEVHQGEELLSEPLDAVVRQVQQTERRGELREHRRHAWEPVVCPEDRVEVGRGRGSQ